MGNAPPVIPGSVVSRTNGRISFATFEVDLSAGELRKSGVKIKLHAQPFAVLAMLLERPGQVVTREEIQQKLWASDTFVDFEHGLNKAINKVREALSDDAGNPRYIETLPRRGYRFIAPVVGGQREVESNADVKQASTLPSVTSDSPAAKKQLKWRMMLGAFAVLLLLVAVGLVVRSRLYHPPSTPFQKFTVTRITNSGKAFSGAISLDGRYIASVLEENGTQSLWLRSLPTGSDTQIIPPTTLQYDQLAFSPDGNYIYFRIRQGTNLDSYDLYRCPVLGGNSQLIVKDLASYAFSPEGQRIAYVRLNYPENGKYRILTASLEGENETVWQVASTVEQPNFMAWSTKGDQIYFSTYARDIGVSAIEVLDLATGKSHHLATFKNTRICEIQEAPDGRGLFATYWNANRWQLGFLRSTGGNIEPIHQDLNSCGDLTLSSDGRALATVYTKYPSTLHVLSKAGSGFREPLPVLSQSVNDVTSLNWSADGNLLIGKADLLLKMQPDGKKQTPILKDPPPFGVSSCGTDYLVLVGNVGTRWQNIWRINADGSGPMPLPSGWTDYAPACSPDQKWLYYVEGPTRRLLRMSLDGSGEAEVISHVPPDRYVMGHMMISPDGKTLAAAVEKPPKGMIDIAVFEVGSSSPPRILAAGISSDTIDLQSMHEGNSVAYVERSDGVDNLWVNRLDGSAPSQITDFKSDQIWAFSFSPDGKRLAILRGHRESDVVLLQESNR